MHRADKLSFDVERQAGLLWRPLRGHPWGRTESFGRGENIGVVVEIPLAIDSLYRGTRTLDDSDNSDNPTSNQSQLHGITVVKGGHF